MAEDAKIVLGTNESNQELEGELMIPQDPRLSGGYADIYQGQWKRSDGVEVEVAVKVFKQVWPKSISMDSAGVKERVEKRLKRELLVWTCVKHPNIHPLLGFRSQPSPRLISSWCRHGNLTDYLGNNPDLSRSDKIKLTIQAARGLAYLHDQSPPICHADIKPENILVNCSREAVLSDFGLGRVMMELTLSSGLTTSDGPKGTLNYLAPELFEEDRPRPTRESDVFAFGGLILAVLSGKPPFAGLLPARIMFFILQGQHPELDQHPPMKAEDPLWLLMVRCWAQNRNLRPRISDVVNELMNELGYPSRSPPVAVPPPVPGSPPANITPVPVPPPVPGSPPANINQGQIFGALLGTLVAYGLAWRDTEPSPTSSNSSDVRKEVGENTPPVPAKSGTASTQDQNGPHFWMTLHNTLVREEIRWNLDTTQDPANPEEWVVELSFPDLCRGNSLGTFNGKGARKADAKNAAAKKALAAINQIKALKGKKSCEPESATTGVLTDSKT